MHPTLVVVGGPNELASRLTLAGIIAIWVIDALAVRAYGGSRAERQQDRGSFLLIQLLQLAAIAGGIFAAYRIPLLALPGNGWPWVMLGLAMMVGGSLFRAWAVRALGRRFRRIVAIDADHEVIASGPYRWLRHPAYTGSVVAMAGVGVALDNVLAVALCLALPLAGYVYRIRVEERALEGALGDAYRRFAASRSRLIPPIY